MNVSPKGAGYKALSADEGGGGKTWTEVLLARLPILSWLPSYDKSLSAGFYWLAESTKPNPPNVEQAHPLNPEQTLNR